MKGLAEAARRLGVLVEVGFSKLTSGYMVIYRSSYYLEENFKLLI